MSAELTVYVKGDPKTGKLGDCPFCHRVLLTLEVKGVPYKNTYIDFADKPAWLLEKSNGKVPVIEEGDFLLPDSGEIVKYLEDKYSEPSMKSSAPADLGANLFPAFRGYLFAKDEEAEEKENVLEEELTKLEAYLSQISGPFFGGHHLNETDAALAPRLYHCHVALGHYKKWQLPESMPALQRYLQEIQKLDAWKRCDYGKDMIIQGWSKHH